MVKKGKNIQPSNSYDSCERYYLQDNYSQDRYLMPTSAKTQKIRVSNCQEEDEVMSFNKYYSLQEKMIKPKLWLDHNNPSDSSSCPMVYSKDFSSEESMQTRCSTKSRSEKYDAQSPSSTVVDGDKGSPENTKPTDLTEFIKHNGNGWKNSRKRTLREDSVASAASYDRYHMKSSRKSDEDDDDHSSRFRLLNLLCEAVYADIHGDKVKSQLTNKFNDMNLNNNIPVHHHHHHLPSHKSMAEHDERNLPLNKRWRLKTNYLTHAEKSAVIVSSPTSTTDDPKRGDNDHEAEMKNNAELTLNDDQNMKPKEYKCNKCGATYQSFRALGGHKSSHTVRIKREGANVIPTLKKKKHKENGGGDNNNQELLHECNMCDKSYSSSKALKMHQRSHYSNNGGGGGGGGPQDQQSSKPLPKRVLDFDLNEPACPEEETEIGCDIDALPSL